MIKIAIVEDDQELSSQMVKMLEKYNYHIHQIVDFKNVTEDILRLAPDLVLLDINLPYYDGYTICKELRRRTGIPIIFISARSSDLEQIMGLELGADDYIVKPFSMEILQAKIKNCIRKTNQLSARGYIIGDVCLDKKTLNMSRADLVIELTKNEFKILAILIENLNEYVTREFILREIWDEESFVNDNTLNVNISRVKNKLAEFGLNDMIKTKRGYGYMLTDRREV